MSRSKDSIDAQVEEFLSYFSEEDFDEDGNLLLREINDYDWYEEESSLYNDEQ